MDEVIISTCSIGGTVAKCEYLREIYTKKDGKMYLCGSNYDHVDICKLSREIKIKIEEVKKKESFF